jgi:hypothetical protein
MHTKNAQDVNKRRQSPPQNKEDADLQMMRAVIEDTRLSDEQRVEVCGRITQPYLDAIDAEGLAFLGKFIRENGLPDVQTLNELAVVLAPHVAEVDEVPQ